MMCFIIIHVSLCAVKERIHMLMLLIKRENRFFMLFLVNMLFLYSILLLFFVRATKKSVNEAQKSDRNHVCSIHKYSGHIIFSSFNKPIKYDVCLTGQGCPETNVTKSLCSPCAKL